MLPITHIHTPVYSLHKTAEDKLKKQTMDALSQKETSDYDPIVKNSLFFGRPETFIFSTTTTACSLQVIPHYQEDYVNSVEWDGYTLDIVCDGHSDNQEASKMVCTQLPIKLKKSLPPYCTTPEIITNALVRACVELDQEYQGPGGTTAVGALIHAGKIYFFNVGDSRAALLKEDGTIDYMSLDAKPNHELFTRALKKQYMGYIPDQYGIPRVFCFGGEAEGCAIARDIGLKGLSPRPKITWADEQMGRIVILATDGLWDIFTKDEIKTRIIDGQSLQKSLDVIAKEIVLEAADRGSKDNITLLLREIIGTYV